MLLIHAANLPKSTKVMSGPKCLRALTLITGLFLAAPLWLAAPLGFAQSPAQSPQQNPKNQPTATPTPSGQNPAPEAGGRQGAIRPIPLPIKKNTEPTKQKA